jgi:DNA-binding beta-propeller fold protein YncE
MDSYYQPILSPVKQKPTGFSICRAFCLIPSTRLDSESSPWPIAFDGQNVWVASAVNDTVIRLTRGRGQIEKTYRVETDPVDVIFDGSSMWVANRFSDSVSKISAVP